MSEWKDIVGRTVRIKFQDGEFLSGKVLYMPRATGDSWVIQDIEPTGLIYYIQNFSFIAVYPEPNTPIKTS